MSKISLAGFLLFLICGQALAVNVTAIQYNGITYTLSDTSNCPNGGAALNYDRKWWCPANPPTYNVALSWAIPVRRENGATLSVSELSGYEIYYTTDNPAVTGIFRVVGGTVARYVASSLPPGVYYFTMSAIDTRGVKSAMSNLVTLKVGP